MLYFGDESQQQFNARHGDQKADWIHLDFNGTNQSHVLKAEFGGLAFIEFGGLERVSVCKIKFVLCIIY